MGSEKGKMKSEK